MHIIKYSQTWYWPEPSNSPVRKKIYHHSRRNVILSKDYFSMKWEILKQFQRGTSSAATYCNEMNEDGSNLCLISPNISNIGSHSEATAYWQMQIVTMRWYRMRSWKYKFTNLLRIVDTFWLMILANDAWANCRPRASIGAVWLTQCHFVNESPETVKTWWVLDLFCRTMSEIRLSCTSHI